MRWLLAQAAAEIGVSVPALIAILAAVVSPLVGAVVFVVRTKDEALRGQAEAHRAERDGWQKSSAAQDDRYERLVDARAKDAEAARAALVQVSTEAMRVVDTMRTDIERTWSTPTSPPLNEPARPPEGAAPNTRRGDRKSRA